MPVTRQRPASSGQPTTSPFTKPCSKHSQEKIKFYCNDHKVLLCSVCVTLEHAVTSCNVNYLLDVTGQPINSKDVTETLSNIDTLTEKTKMVLNDLRKLTEKSNDSLANTLEEIKKFRQEVNERLDNLEKETETAMKAFIQDNYNKLQTTEETISGIIRSLKLSADSIKLFNSSNQAEKLFIELKSAENLLKDKEMVLLKLTTTGLKQYSFKPNNAILHCLENESLLGMLSEVTMKVSSPSPPTSALRQGGIYIKTSDNLNTCWITGMVLLSTSRLAIVDHENQCVKMVDIGTQSISYQLELNNWLWDVTMVTKDKIAVTLPDQQIIQFISVTSNKLDKANQLKVDGQCYGINCFKEKLAVTFNYPGKLEIIDLKGDVLMTVTTNSNLEDLFREPEYVVANSNSIYVSDCKREAVIQLNWRGELVSKYRSTGAPKGLVMLNDGSLLVAYSHEDKCSIQHVRGDCTKGEAILEDLKHPHAICYCSTTNTVYIGYHRAGERNDNCIQIFRI